MKPHQHQISPPIVSAHEWANPEESETTGLLSKFIITGGMDTSRDNPPELCPNSFDPQQTTNDLLDIEHVWLCPELRLEVVPNFE